MAHWHMRPATDHDRSAIVALWHQGWHDAHCELVPPEILAHRQPRHFSLWMDECLADSVVACAAETVCGFYSVAEREVERFYVARSARGTGLASALLTHAEATLATRGVDTGELFCTEGNLRAQAFYERQGWSLAGRLMDRLWLPHGQHCEWQVATRRYAKRLAPPPPTGDRSGCPAVTPGR